MKRWIVSLAFLGHILVCDTLYANDTAQEIEQSWKNSPEFKRFNELGWEKSQQALEIRENTVKKIAWEKLKLFIDAFDERIRDRNREKIDSYPATIQVILSEAYDKWYPIIQDKSRRNLNVFNSWLITYIDQLNNMSWKSEQAAQNLFKRFPEFEWTEFQKILLDTWKSFDNMWVNIDKIEKWTKVIDMLKKL